MTPEMLLVAQGAPRRDMAPRWRIQPLLLMRISHGAATEPHGERVRERQ